MINVGAARMLNVAGAQTITTGLVCTVTAGVQMKLQTILGGKAGQEPADALRGWEGNKPLQNRLTDAQKKLFHESIANNPQKGIKNE